MTDQQARYWSFDEPGGAEKLQLLEGPVQEPRHGEVRLRVESASLNRSDLLLLSNTYVEIPVFPSRFGSEVAGVVEAVGPGVTNVAIGDRVTSINAFSISIYGMFGERPIIPARALLPVPERLSSAEAASFGFAYMTNYFGLFEVANIKPLQSVLVTAATSTTGLAALPMIKSAGAVSIATTRSRDKADVLLSAGADHVIVTDEEDLVARVNDITAGRGVDVAYDCAPGTLGDQICEAIRVRGYWLTYGFLGEPARFPWLTFASRSQKFDFYKVSEFAGNPAIDMPGNEEIFQIGKRTVAEAISTGLWPTVRVDKQFEGIKAVPDAVSYMASNQGAGKTVIVF